MAQLIRASVEPRLTSPAALTLSPYPGDDAVGVASRSASSPDQTLSCLLCRSHLKDARVLPVCLHTFCFQCLVQHAHGLTRFACPLCSETVDLGQSGSLESLAPNPYYNMFDSSGPTEPDGGGQRRLANGQLAPRPAGPPPPLQSRTAALMSPRPTAATPREFLASAERANPIGPPVGGRVLGQPRVPPNPWGAPGTELVSESTWLKKPDSIWQTPFDLGPTLTPGSDDGWQTQGGWPPKAPAVELINGVSPGPVIPPQGLGPVCQSCDEKHSVTSRCRDCNEDLCDMCVVAHQRVKLTRDHVIVRYPDRMAQTLSSAVSSILPPASGSSSTTRSPPHSISSVGSGNIGVQNADVLRVYADAVDKAKSDRERLIFQAKQDVRQIEETRGLVTDMEKRVNIRHQSVLQEIQSITRKYTAILQEREKFLMMRLNKIRSVKLGTLDAQRQMMDLSVRRLGGVSEQLNACGGNVREMALIDTCNQAMETIREIRFQCGGATPHEDEQIEFLAPDPQMMDTLANIGYIAGSGFAPLSVAEGDGLKRAILGKDARFQINIKDQLGEPKLSGTDPVKVVITSPDGRPVRTSIFDVQNGNYRVIWKPNVEGEHMVNVTLKDKHVQESPFKVYVRAGRNYSTIGKPLFSFGSEGEANGQLCRPWGVCCSKEGLIFVADRSNNRIMIFTKDGKYHRKFGTSGKLNGQFDRPASVCSDRLNRLIVADKDNHRIQIFTMEGEFINAFGEKGSKPGQFNYPWDVACNSKSQIMVSDTRNHRIQLFSPQGEFLSKYGFEGPMWKHFDSPRGLCFTADDQAVVTDFNNHRLLVVRADFEGAQFLGKEGTDDGNFTRPNGVCVDEEGHLVVADSRNDRIQIFTSSGVFLKKFGSKGAGPGEFDRPSGVCISPEGHLVVVDFGNNRVQVF